jgi:hypothetical protein
MARLEGHAQAELDVSDVRLDVVDLASHLFQYWRFYAARLAEKEYSVSSFKLKTLVGNIIPAADKAKGLGDADRRSSTHRPRIRTSAGARIATPALRTGGPARPAMSPGKTHFPSLSPC